MAGILRCPGLCGLSSAKESIYITLYTPRIHQHITTTDILAGVARRRKVWHYRHSISSDGLLVSQVILQPRGVVITHQAWIYLTANLLRSCGTPAVPG